MRVFFFLLLWFVVFPSFLEAETIVLAVLAKRGKELTLKRWKPLVSYLNRMLTYEVKLEPLPFEELSKAVREGEVDLVLANPAMYVELEACCGLAPIVTMKNLKFGRIYTRFGGVIFTRADRTDIKDLKSLKRVLPLGEKLLVGAVNPDSFGGWIMQWREFERAGLKKGKDYEVKFFGTHDAVVYAVLRGEVDIGCVRSDTLETMASEGRIELKRFRVINRRYHPDFDLLVSTQLYPEWPLARTPRLPLEVAEEIAAVLLVMPYNSEVARATGAAWTIPYNYQPVHDCLKELGVGPYAELKTMLLREQRKKYLKFIFGLALLTVTAFVTALYILSLHRKLARAFRELERHRDHLEELVKERTLHLERLTRNLKEEVEERKKAELKIREERERLAVILRSLAEAVIVTDTSGLIVMLNPAAEDLLEVKAKDVIGKKFCEVVNLELPDQVCSDVTHKTAEDKEFVAFEEAKLVLPSGKELIVEGAASPVHSEESEILGSVVVIRDVTLKKYLEAEALKASRLEALRLIASGVAHDFNNLLSSIVSYLNLVKMKLKDEALLEALEKAENACFMAKTLTRELLTYTVGGGPIKRLTDLKELIEKNISFALSGSNVKAEVDIQEDLWQAEVDPDQISICLQNILLNARQVMPEGGKVFVRAKNLWLPAGNEFGLEEGPYIQIEVEDTGPGIPKEDLPKIFEPFFTTKEGGSGLGLFSCKRIVEAHGGRILAESPPGKGAIFRVIIPASPKETAKVEKAPAEEKRPGVSAKILIMDDEEGIREPIAEILRAHGFRVETAESGERALELFKKALEENDPFDLVILDLTVPGGMGGKELLPKLRELHPRVKAIVASGYSSDPVMEHYEDYGFNGAIIKPFAVKDLLQLVQRVLSE